MKKLFTICIVPIFIVFYACKTEPDAVQVCSYALVDSLATDETKALFVNLMKIQDEGRIIFGQQDAIMYGRNWQGDENRSDVKDVTGDHPALIGLDYEYAADETEEGRRRWAQLVKAVKDTYSRGGIITFCWHMKNPANDSSFYWEQNPVKVVSDILPGGKHHSKYKANLNRTAGMTKEFKGANGELIPIIFRPFHEFEGDWFWWGQSHRTKEEFIELWKFTVHYMRDSLQVHNFLYAFSPDCRFNTTGEYLDCYPGDEYVDILGMDNYWDFRPDGGNSAELAEKKLTIVSTLAREKNKVAALTETGLEGIPDSTWFTKTLLPVLRKSKVAYVQIWRNAYRSETHYYAPTKGHAAEKDFIEFYKQDDILFESELPEMYKLTN